jgi:2-polyprenyl-3-methyl-5-hydroxy-6-metoxy-1,4-benzoquinol methylase
MSGNFIKRNACPCCGSNSYKVIYSVKFSDEKIWPFLKSYYEGRIPKKKVESDDYNIARCSDCDLLFQEYILNESNMFLLYEKWISAKKSLHKKKHADIGLYQKYALEIEGICKFLNKKPHEINVLEYGMGWGFWSNLAKAYNYNVTGVEISKTRVAFAKKNGLRVIEEISQEKGHGFDYIYSDQVFEHIPKPKETIRELARVLEKNGIIHMQVPNGRGMERGLRRSNWNAQKGAIQPLEHINCFNRNSLKVLADQADLTLRPPLYGQRSNEIKPFLKRHMKYVSDLYWSTQVYMTKS